jgi:HPt (histidine-containing phosphotransfer) domain-containing protein
MQTEKILLQAPTGIPARMVTDYVNRYLIALPVAKTALEKSDYGHMRVLGHRLSGTGGAYGIPALTRIGSAIEDAARRDDTPELRRQVSDLEAYLSRLEILEG